MKYIYAAHPFLAKVRKVNNDHNSRQSSIFVIYGYNARCFGSKRSRLQANTYLLTY